MIFYFINCQTRADTFYKEYEFIYEEEKMEYHGIIDLLIETPKEMIIIDYKLEQVRESSYQKQLEGYQKYIAKKTNKPVKTYLYSILDEHLEMLSLEK